MKKTLLIGMLLAASLGVNAQEEGLPDGTVAPDFTATDLNNQVHHLQDYLDEGKTVILYISATWCGPCWQFHNTHYLEDIYEAYGPAGSDEIQIFYIEGDATTTVNHMYGIGSSNKTQGNWVEGTTYPMINSSDIADAYEIAYFPTIYRICPEDGTTTQIERGTPAELIASIEDNCGELTGIPNAAKVTAQDLRFCEETGKPRATITNVGSDITSVTAELTKNGAVVGTQTFEMELGAFEQGAIEFESMVLDAEADYQVEITAVNGGAPYAENAEFLVSEEFDAVPNASVESYDNIVVTVHTDDYPGEMTWRILNSAGEISAFQNYSSSSSNKNTTKVHNVVLPSNDCYSVLLLDDYGDGWVYGNAQHGMQITSNGEVLFESDGDIGSGEYTEAVFHTNGQLGSQKHQISGLSIYPNPSTGIFTIATDDTVAITVFDITGKTVFTSAQISNGESINLTSLQSGVYIAKLKGTDNMETTEKLIIK